MRPQDIERIARSVSGSFASAPVFPRAGCGSLSNPAAYDCDSFSCGDDYECGNAGSFTCGGDFGCVSSFYCAADFTTSP